MSEDLKIEPGKTRWNEVFHRSKMSPYIFVVSKLYTRALRDFWKVLDLPCWSFSMMFGNAYWVSPFLDGLIHLMSTSGLPSVPSGLRIVGHRPLRLLCDMLKLIPPKKLLPGETAIPSRDELLAELAAQRAMPKEYLEAQAKLGLSTHSTEEFRKMVVGLFGCIEKKGQDAHRV